MEAIFSNLEGLVKQSSQTGDGNCAIIIATDLYIKIVN
jgi:hypothetical protein